MSGYANEETALLNHHGNSGNNNGIAASMSFGLGSVIGGLQVVALAVMLALFKYESVDEFSTEKYIVFRDIMIMLLLGFGYL